MTTYFNSPTVPIFLLAAARKGGLTVGHVGLGIFAMGYPAYAARGGTGWPRTRPL